MKILVIALLIISFLMSKLVKNRASWICVVKIFVSWRPSTVVDFQPILMRNRKLKENSLREPKAQTHMPLALTPPLARKK